MLGWVITCHDDRAQEILGCAGEKHGALLHAPEFLAGCSYAQPHDVRCRALVRDLIFLTDIAGVYCRPAWHY